jgi:hypothetical protein
MKLYQVVDKIHNALKKDITIDLPNSVEKCPMCKGLGKYEQRYTAGCGMVSYRSIGPCDYCKLEGLFMQGSGFRYKNGKFSDYSVPESVLYQIYEINKPAIEIAEQIEHYN